MNDLVLDGTVVYSEDYFRANGLDVRIMGVVADGEALNAVALQAAEDYASQIGANLLFPVGVIVLEAAIVKKSNVHWHGQGPTLSILRHHDTSAHPTYQAHELVKLPETGPDTTMSADNVGFFDIGFDGNRYHVQDDDGTLTNLFKLLRNAEPGVSAPAHGLTIERCHFVHATFGAFSLHVAGYDRVNIRDCYLADGGGAASTIHLMYLRHCARVSVTGCIAEPREASAGIKVQGIYERAEIAGCSVTGGGIGIAGTDCYDYRIVGNSIRDATSEGIKLAIDQESTARFLVISNNTISNCTFGIWAQNIQGVSGSGNHFRDCGTGIRFKGVRGGMLSATFMELTSNTSNPSNSEGAVTFLLFEKPNVSPNPESPPTYNECNFSGLSIRNGRAGTGVTIAKNIGTVEHPSTLEDAKYLIFDGVSVIGSFAATWLNINPPPESPNEGSFAPTLIGGATAGEGTYTTQAGRWQRVGSRCNFEINLSWSAHTGSGELIVDALPFVASSTLGAYPVRFYWRDIAITSGSQLIGYVIGGEKRIRLRLLPASGAPAALQVPASGSLDIAGSYIVQG